MNEQLPEIQWDEAEQRRAEAARFWAEFIALGCNINRLDPNDPIWLEPSLNDNEAFDQAHDG